MSSVTSCKRYTREQIKASRRLGYLKVICSPEEGSDIRTSAKRISSPGGGRACLQTWRRSSEGSSLKCGNDNGIFEFVFRIRSSNAAMISEVNMAVLNVCCPVLSVLLDLRSAAIIGSNLCKVAWTGNI